MGGGGSGGGTSGGGASGGGPAGGAGGGGAGGSGGGGGASSPVAPTGPKTEQVVYSGPDAVDPIKKAGGTWVTGPDGNPRIQIPNGGTIKGVAGTTDPNAPPGTTWIDPNDPYVVVVEQPVPTGPTHTHTGKPAIDELKRQGWPPAVNPETGKPLIDPATGDPLVRVPGGMPGNVRGAGFTPKIVGGVEVIDPNKPVVIITQDPATPPTGGAGTGAATGTQPGGTAQPGGPGTTPAGGTPPGGTPPVVPPGQTPPVVPPGQTPPVVPPGQTPPVPPQVQQPQPKPPQQTQPGSADGGPAKGGAPSTTPKSGDDLVRTLTQPGGGTVTIPPGSVASLIPPKFIDQKGNLVIPSSVPIPDALRGFLTGPPPSFSVQSDGTIGVYGADIRVGVDPKTGQLTASGAIGAFDSPFGKFEGKDLTGPLTQAVKPINDALAAKGLKVTGVTVDPKTGVTVTTGPK